MSFENEEAMVVLGVIDSVGRWSRATTRVQSSSIHGSALESLGRVGTMRPPISLEKPVPPTTTHNLAACP
jgi:hypothetical protein